MNQFLITKTLSIPSSCLPPYDARQGAIFVLKFSYFTLGLNDRREFLEIFAAGVFPFQQFLVSHVRTVKRERNFC